MKIIALRGGMGLGPENTIGTMQQALKKSADGLHMDIRCSMDDVPVLLHDAKVDRTTNGSGEVFRIMADTLAGLDAGEGRHLPTLVKTLDMFMGTQATLFLELKHPATALPTAEVVNTYITKKNMPNQQLVIITSYHQLLALIKDKFPKLVTGAIVKTIPESLAAFGEYTRSQYVLPPIDLLTDDFMADAKRRSLQVFPWVVDSPAQLDAARKFGVDGILTSDPSKARSA